MKKPFLFITLFLFSSIIAGFPVFAQSILDPNDIVVDYDKNNPPSPPPYGTIGKWVRTPTLNWNTDAWKAYYYKGMAFRVIFPKSYQENPDKTYPLLVFFHGEGEAGPVYNNELQLKNCGNKLQSMVLNGSFDAFIIFPQSTYGGWAGSQFTTIDEFINYMITNNRVDRFRVMATGLSSGGDGTWKFTAAYPKLISACIPISSTTAAEKDPSFINAISEIPIWLSQGGSDTNPLQTLSDGVVKVLTDSGMDIRTVQPGAEGLGPASEGYYIVYPGYGHNTWDVHFKEPEAFSYMLRAYKSNPHVSYGRREFCPGTPINVTLGLTAGFDGYEWSRNGIVLAGANTSSLTVTDTGSYAARVKDGNTWSNWSPWPADIKYKSTTITPPIQVSGLMSKVIPSPDGNTSVTLEEPMGYASYEWRNSLGQVVGTDRLYTATQSGSYVAIVTEIYGCSAQVSDSFYVASSNGPNPPDPASGLSGYALSQTAIQLNWSNNLNPVHNETAFEIYRSTQPHTLFKLVGVNSRDSLAFIDESLLPNTKYFYFVRAVDSTGSAIASNLDSVTTIADRQMPTAPNNLQVSGATPSSISLKWDASIDNIAVKNYYVYVNGIRSYTTTDTNYTIYNLTKSAFYTLYVKATDSAGNVSSPSNQVVAAASYRGFSYKYYTYSGSWKTLPDLSEQPIIKTGMVPNITLTPTVQPTNYAFSFQGYINIRQSGIYTFYASSDDGSNLYINNVKVVSNDGLHGTTEKSGNYTFSQPGLYPIRLDYYQEGGGAVLTLSWSSASLGIAKAQIPDSAFIENVASTGSIPAFPTQITATALSFDSIRLHWIDNSRDESGFEIYRSTQASGSYQIVFTTKSDSVSYIDTSLSPATTYYYKVQAINGYGASGYDPNTQAHNFATTMALPPSPSAPVDLSANAVATDEVNLTWNGSQGMVTGFDLYRSDGVNTMYRKLLTLPSTSTSYIDSGLFANTVYYYKLKAIGLGGSSGFSNEANDTTLNHIPAIVSILSQSIRFDTTTAIRISATDEDNELLRFWCQNLPEFGSVADNGDGSGALMFSPSVGQVGVYHDIKVYVEDQHGGVDSTIFTLTVNSDYSPVIEDIGLIRASTSVLTIDTVSVANPTAGSGLTWSTAGLPAFIDTFITTNGSLGLKIHPEAADSGSYTFNVSVGNSSGGKDEVVVSLIVNFVPLRNWYFNFASSYGWLAMPGSPWNNVKSDTIEGAKDSEGNVSGIGLELHTNWWSTYTNGAQTGNNSGVYPDEVLRDYYYFGISGGPDIVTGSVTGLSATKTYSITLYGNSVWGITPDNGYTVYEVNGRRDSLHVQGNTSKTVTFSGITPTQEGTIDFKMSKGLGAKAGFLNALVVTTDASVPPAKPINISLSNRIVGGSSVVEVDWQKGSKNTDTILVYRSDNHAGDYILLNPNMANGDSVRYFDMTVSAGATYYYYLVGANADGRSLGTDTVGITTTSLLPSNPGQIELSINAIDHINTVKVAWHQGSDNTDTVMIYRADHPDGAYVLLNPGVANGDSTSYIDTSVTLGDTYYYYLIAANGYGESGSSDTVGITVVNSEPPSIDSIPDVSLEGGMRDTIHVKVAGSTGGITLSLHNAPSFTALIDNLDGSGNIVLTPSDSDRGYYDSVRVIAIDGEGNSASMYFDIYVTDGGLSDIIYLNYSDVAHTYAPDRWNNLSFSSGAGRSFNNLINSYGQRTNVNITLVNAWSGADNHGANTYSNSGPFPDSVMTSYYDIQDNNVRTIELSGLDPVKRYNVVFFGSSIYGDDFDYSTNYEIGQQTVTINNIRNTSKLARFNGIMPDPNGKITIAISKASYANQAVLNAMEVESYVAGTLISPSSLIAVADTNRIVLNWQDRSDNEQSFEIWRSSSLVGAFTKIAEVPANSTTYRDITAASNSKYFYKVRAQGLTGGVSKFSDVADATTPQYVVYINFNLSPDASSPWNNTDRSPDDGDVYGPFYDSRGRYTDIGISMGDNFLVATPAGVSTGNNSGVYPDIVMQSVYLVDKGDDTIEMNINNLNISMQYDLTFFGSIVTAGWNNTTLFMVNGRTASLTTSYNSTETTSLRSIFPDGNGQIRIKIPCTPESRYVVLSAIVIQVHNAFDSSGNLIGNPKYAYLRTTGSKDIGFSSTRNSIIQSNDNSALSVYPNPFSDYIKVRMSSRENDRFVFSLFNSGGALEDRQSRVVSKGMNMFDIRFKSKLPPGFYLLDIRSATTGRSRAIKLIRR